LNIKDFDNAYVLPSGNRCLMGLVDFLLPKVPDIEEMKRIQEKVAKMVVKRDEIGELKTVAGCDVSFVRGDRAFAACVVLDYRTLKPLETKVVEVKVGFPYIPSFLAFRELEPMLKAVAGMDASVYMVGAHGYSHPRRAGLASHLGVILDKPTIGAAKSILCGESKEPDEKRGSIEWVTDGGEIIGAAVRTVEGRRPIYVSVGHKVSLETAIRIVLETTTRGLLPEPILQAHRLATQAAREKFG
jgi:deoxyribonuclease V